MRECGGHVPLGMYMLAPSAFYLLTINPVLVPYNDKC
jgi:hypothetical protein